MPDILNVKGDAWELTVWTRNNEKPYETLKSILDSRGKPVSEEQICVQSKNQGELDFTVSLPGKISPENAVKTGDFIPLASPLCYENRDYEFEFTFLNEFMPDADQPIFHRLREVTESFRLVGKSGLRGRLNFGNQVGGFRLGIQYLDKSGTRHHDFISFQVWPTKMDMAEDLEQMLTKIDAEYPLWRFALAQKTDSELARSRKPHERFELLWLAQFESMAQELSEAVKIVSRAPHSRLLSDVKLLKADRISGRISGKMEERIKENLIAGNFDKRYRIEKKKLSFDTPENRFVKMVLTHSVQKIGLFSDRVRKWDEPKFKQKERLSNSFYGGLKELTQPFEQVLREPLFKEIGDFGGQMRESLVLHQRAGYAKVYRIWQELKLYLDFFGSDAKISQRSVEQLYEIWCLLEIKHLLEELGFRERTSSKSRLTKEGLERGLNDEAVFELERGKVKIKLAHEPIYSNKENPDLHHIYSWTTTQKPDIYLEVTFPDKMKHRWVFDAKYRIDTDGKDKWPKNANDRVPDDAINQMHRYRDALIHIHEAKEDQSQEKTRPVIGAFALYPGWFEQENGVNPYNLAIEEVGIGAFPLLPSGKDRSDNVWLKEFLISKLGDGSDQLYEENGSDLLMLNEAVRIPPSGLRLEWRNSLTLFTKIYSKNNAYKNQFISGDAKWYHMPVSTTENHKITRALVRELKYFAVINDLEAGHNVQLYRITKVEMKPRDQINFEAGGTGRHPGSKADYWLFTLKFERMLHEQFDYLREDQRKYFVKLVELNELAEAETNLGLKEFYKPLVYEHKISATKQVAE